MRVSYSLSECLSLFSDLHRVLLARSARGGDVHCFERDGARYSIRFTGSQRQKQMAGLKIGSPDQVDGSQPCGAGPTDIDPQQIRFRNLARVTFDKVKTAQTNLPAPQYQRKECASESARQSEPHCFQDRAQDRETFLDMTAHQQLLGSTPPQIESPCG